MTNPMLSAFLVAIPLVFCALLLNGCGTDPTVQTTTTQSSTTTTPAVPAVTTTVVKTQRVTP
jgi:hypothetical protein